MAEAQKLPLTLLSGLAEKGPLLSSLLKSEGGLKVAVVAKDPGSLPEAPAGVSSWDEPQVLAGGGALLAFGALGKLQPGAFDALCVECKEPEARPVIAAFLQPPGHGYLAHLTRLARLDTLVTVVDGESFLADCDGTQTLRERGIRAAPGEVRTVAELLVDQVESADRVLVAGSGSSSAQLTKVLGALNPRAKVVHDVKEVLKTGSFGEETLLPGWMRALRGEARDGGWVFRAERPFRPERLESLLKEGFQGVVRAKGFAWAAGDAGSVVDLGLAGPMLRLKDGGKWLAGEQPEEQWPEEARQFRGRKFGDRRQELAFVGGDEAGIRARLERALLTEEELAMGEEAWAKWPKLLPVRRKRKRSAGAGRGSRGDVEMGRGEGHGHRDEGHGHDGHGDCDGHGHDEHGDCKMGHGDEEHGHGHDDHGDGHGHGHKEKGHGHKDEHGHGHDDHSDCDGHGHGHKEEGHGHGHDDHSDCDGHGHGHKDKGHGHKDEHGHGHDDHGDCDGHGHGHDDKSHGHKDEHGHGHDDHSDCNGHGHGHKDKGHGHKEEGHGHGHDDHSDCDGHGHGHKEEGHGHKDEHGHGHDDHSDCDGHGHGHDDKGHGHKDEHGHGHDDHSDCDGHGHGHKDKGHGHKEEGHGHKDEHGHGHDDHGDCDGHGHKEEGHGHGHDDHGDCEMGHDDHGHKGHGHS